MSTDRTELSTHRVAARLQAQAIQAERLTDPWLANLCWRKRTELGHRVGLALTRRRPALMKFTRERVW